MLNIICNKHIKSAEILELQNERIQYVFFYTTTSDTGRINGACTLLKIKLVINLFLNGL